MRNIDTVYMRLWLPLLLVTLLLYTLGVPYYPSWNQDRPYLSGDFLLQPGLHSLQLSICNATVVLHTTLNSALLAIAMRLTIATVVQQLLALVQRTLVD
jgi:hypothetical protein